MEGITFSDFESLFMKRGGDVTIESSRVIISHISKQQGSIISSPHMCRIRTNGGP